MNFSVFGTFARPDKISYIVIFLCNLSSSRACLKYVSEIRTRPVTPEVIRDVWQ